MVLCCRLDAGGGEPGDWRGVDVDEVDVGEVEGFVVVLLEGDAFGAEGVGWGGGDEDVCGFRVWVIGVSRCGLKFECDGALSPLILSRVFSRQKL